MQSSRNGGKATLHKNPWRLQPMSEQSHVTKIKEKMQSKTAATGLNPLESIQLIEISNMNDLKV